MARYEDLPYRTCVGMMLTNRRARFDRPARRPRRTCRRDPCLASRRKAASIPARTPGRRPSANSTEETSVRSVEKLGEVADWLIYDIPRTVAGRTWKGRYRGQRQKWFAVRFTGKDDEINVANPGGGHKAEFVNWRWEPMKNFPNLIVPFKRPVYERVVLGFLDPRSRTGSLAGNSR